MDHCRPMIQEECKQLLVHLLRLAVPHVDMLRVIGLQLTADLTATAYAPTLPGRRPHLPSLVLHPGPCRDRFPYVLPTDEPLTWRLPCSRRLLASQQQDDRFLGPSLSPDLPSFPFEQPAPLQPYWSNQYTGLNFGKSLSLGLPSCQYAPRSCGYIQRQQKRGHQVARHKLFASTSPALSQRHRQRCSCAHSRTRIVRVGLRSSDRAVGEVEKESNVAIATTAGLSAVPESLLSGITDTGRNSTLVTTAVSSATPDYPFAGSTYSLMSTTTLIPGGAVQQHPNSLSSPLSHSHNQQPPQQHQTYPLSPSSGQPCLEAEEEPLNTNFYSLPRKRHLDSDRTKLNEQSKETLVG
ncbi:unnamed protein product [Protopolystoma xenopodis]|uniref:Uncharacterized protein n=1 Tax=Protopolystoma xenopodis TaxID=117903 RepID=A0A3S5CDC5_9PLAT|nr:unnamed protein product [Protopolystoma xenopodis]